MGRSYYGVPGVSPDEDDSYYYEYEPILTTKDEGLNLAEESGLSPAQLIIFFIGLPFLPIWTGLAILIHSLRIAGIGDRSPDRRSQMELELKGFIILFVLGIIMYLLVFPFLRNFYMHAP